jgi:hypothetical protein
MCIVMRGVIGTGESGSEDQRQSLEHVLANVDKTMLEFPEVETATKNRQIDGKDHHFQRALLGHPTTPSKSCGPPH